MQNKIWIHTEDDVYYAVFTIRRLIREMGFDEIDEQKICVCVLELTRNVLDHGGGKGYFKFEPVQSRGIRIEVTDYGSGMDHSRTQRSENIPASKGLGLGLAGSRRLMDDFNLFSSKEGTRIIATKWKKEFART